MVCVTALTEFDPQLAVGDDRAEAVCEHRFAVSGASGRLYWSLAVYSRELQAAQGFWERLEQLAGRAMSLVGATSYSAPDERWVYVFVQVDEDARTVLQGSRYSLTRGQWETDVITLDGPDNVSRFTAWLLPGQPPRIALAFTTEANGVRQASLVYRSMNQKGTGWDKSEFAPLTLELWKNLGQPIGASGANTTKVLAGDIDGDGQ